MANVWTDDWKTRLQQCLLQKGFHDAIEFAKLYPTFTYDELVNQLNDDLAPIQLLWTLRDQAIQTYEINWFVKDLLVRFIRELCQDGWMAGEDGEFNALHARSSWISEITPIGQDVQPKAELIRDRLKTIAPKGWLPTNIEDPIIQEAFEGVSFDQISPQPA